MREFKTDGSPEARPDMRRIVPARPRRTSGRSPRINGSAQLQLCCDNCRNYVLQVRLLPTEGAFLTLIATRRARPTSNAHGFTLIEAMVVVALVAILAALAAPSFNTMIANQRVASAAQELQILLQFARADAVYRRAETVVVPNGQKWEAKAGALVLRETVVPDAVTVEPGSANGVQFAVTGNVKPATGNPPYVLKFSSPRASRVYCLSLNGAGVVVQKRVAAGQACS
jgi:prepilin-type N-terminal cleavage/methylation domain-containing protein